jgi:hypothetical protein
MHFTAQACDPPLLMWEEFNVMIRVNPYLRQLMEYICKRQYKRLVCYFGFESHEEEGLL